MLRSCLLKLLFLLSVFVVNGQSKVLNQFHTSVSISANNLPLDVVFDQLSTQTGCYFTYNAQQIDGNKKITLKVKNITLKQALDTLLQNPIFNYELVNNQVVIHPIRLQSKTKVPVVLKKTISGILVDSENNNPLPFASIIIKNTSFGGISNKNGKFTLNIPEIFFNDTLVFYYMGYHSKEIPVASIDSNIRVNLISGNVSLQEVIVRSIEPKYLLKKARNLINENYYKQAYNFEAFYRESIKKGFNYRLYSEALISGYKPAISSANRTNRVQIVKARRYNNIRQSDTLVVKLRGGMEACFNLDLIHELPDFLQEQGEELYNYNINDITIWNEELVYVLSFKQKDYISEPLFEGEIYVTVDNQAILGAEFAFSKKLIRKTKNFFVVKKTRQLRIQPVSTKYLVQYSQWKGKYYTKHVRGELVFKARKKLQLIKDNYSTLMEMVYTEIDTADVLKPDRKVTFRTNTVFSDSEQVYDEKYWYENTIINPEYNILKALKSSGFTIQHEGIFEK